MKQIQPTTVQVKLSDGHEDEYVLVHDGTQIIEVVAPGSGKFGTHPRNTMVAGTKSEIDAEIDRLKLTAKPQRRVPTRPDRPGQEVRP
ncbi:MAG: hypothetical protein ACE37H_00730 [Phycisphaeraceae bacterium]